MLLHAGKRGIFQEPAGKAEKLDELPFDYDRKCVSILLSVHEKGNYIITKGDVDSVYSRCRYVCHHDQVIEVDPSDSGGVHTVVDEMLEDGMKVLAVACSLRPVSPSFIRRMKGDLILLGYVVFSMLPKVRPPVHWISCSSFMFM